MGNINTMLAVNGEAEFRRQLNLINSNLKTLEKELQATSTQFAVGSQKMQQATNIAANYGKQLEFLKAKQDVLKGALSNADKQLEANKNKLSQAQQTYSNISNTVNQYRNTIEKLKARYGENHDAVTKLEASLKKLEKEQKQAAKAVTEAEKEVDKTAKAYHRYRQDLADTVTAINKAEAAQRKANETTGNTKSKIDVARSAFKLFGDTLTLIPVNLSKVSETMGSIANVSFKAMQTSIKAVTTELNLGTQGLEAYVKGLTAVGTAVVGFSAGTGMSFEAAMSKVKAYAGIGDDENGVAQMEALTAAAKKQGAETTKTATEAAEALGYLSLNGYKTEQMLTVLPAIVKASEAGTMDLATVANLTARSLTAYGKGAEDAEEFLNILVAAQNNSSTSLYDLLTAYADMAGTFRSLNIDMKESATILGVFANQGTSGSEAATALSAVMLRLVGANKKASEALSSIGVEAWDDAENFRGLTTVLKELGTALQDLTPEKETLIESQIGGVMRIQELKKLINGVMDDEQYQKVFEPIDNAIQNGTLFATAATMMDNLKGKVELLKSAVSGLGLSIYDTFSKSATDSVETMSHWVNILDAGVQSGSLATMLDSMSAVSSRMSAELSKGIDKAGKQLPSDLKIYNKLLIESLKLGLQGLSEGKDTILPELIEGTTNLVLDIADFLPELTEDMADGAETLFSGILDGMQKTADKLVDEGILDNVVSTITEFFETNTEPLLTAGLSILGTIGSGISENLDELLGTAMEIVTQLAVDMAEKAPDAIEEFGNVVAAIVGAITADNNLEKLVDAAVDIIHSLAVYIGENSDNIISGCETLIGRIHDELLTDTNKEKMYEAGRELGITVLKGLLTAIISIKKENWSNLFSAVTGGGWWDDLSEMLTGQSRIEWIDDILRSDAGVSTATSTNSNGTTNTDWIGAVHVDMSGSVINGYSDLETLIDDTSEIINQKQNGGGRY